MNIAESKVMFVWLRAYEKSEEMIDLSQVIRIFTGGRRRGEEKRTAKIYKGYKIWSTKIKSDE